MNSAKLKENKWKYLSKLEVIIQSLDDDNKLWDYVIGLKIRLVEKGFLFPSEYKMLDNWKVAEPYLK